MNNLNLSQDRVEELRERIRKELFGNLCHYRQHCISERDDAITVAKFIDDEIASRLESGSVTVMREALEKIAGCDSHHPNDVVAIAREALARIGRSV